MTRKIPFAVTLAVVSLLSVLPVWVVAGPGGGRVATPPVEFLTGPVRLLSNVNLHILAGATLRFSADPARYLPVVFTRWEGVALRNYAPLVYAFEQKNLAITGSGTLDGQADPLHWWPWKAAAGAES